MSHEPNSSCVGGRAEDRGGGLLPQPLQKKKKTHPVSSKEERMFDPLLRYERRAAAVGCPGIIEPSHLSIAPGGGRG